MNSTVVLFGYLRDNFTVFPNKNMADFLKKISENILYPTQIIICRKDKLIYYNYIRLLKGHTDSKPCFFGMTLLLNGVMVADVGRIFPFFEDIFCSIAFENRILGIDDGGEILPMCTSLQYAPKDNTELVSAIMNRSQELDPYCIKLPPLDFSISINEKRCFLWGESILETVKNYGTYPLTVIGKDIDYNSPRLSEYLTRLIEIYGPLKSHRRESVLQSIALFFHKLKK